MITQDRREARDIRHHRLRRYVRGSPARPRLAVFRSLAHMYAQLIDDESGRTLVAVDSRGQAFRARQHAGGNVAAAKVVELLIAETAGRGIERDLRSRWLRRPRPGKALAEGRPRRGGGPLIGGDAVLIDRTAG
jgi:large subunit ribosomal protein L18